MRNYMNRMGLLLGVFGLPLCGLAHAERPAVLGSQRHEVLLATPGKVVKLSKSGEVVWEYPAPKTHDAWMLSNGNVLFAYSMGKDRGGVKEVTPAKEVVFEVEIASEVHTCQRLPNGNTLLSDDAQGRIVEVNPLGEIVKEVKVQYEAGGHGMMRHIRKLANGNYLVGHHMNKRVREYDGEGNIVWECAAEAPVFAAVRLANGNTVMADWHAITEVNPEKEIVWQVKKSEIVAQLVPGGGPEVESGEALMTGIHRLPNGNTVVANYFGHAKGERSAALFEVTKGKKVVWQFTDVATAPAVMGVQILDVPGDAAAFEVLR